MGLVLLTQATECAAKGSTPGDLPDLGMIQASVLCFPQAQHRQAISAPMNTNISPGITRSVNHRMLRSPESDFPARGLGASRLNDVIRASD